MKKKSKDVEAGGSVGGGRVGAGKKGAGDVKDELDSYEYLVREAGY
jgi:hypothetical protein